MYPLVHGAYPQVLLRVGEHLADSEAGHLEGESVLALAGHAAGARVVVEHAVSGGVQQQAVVAVGVYVVDVGVAQRGVSGDGLRQRLELRVRVSKMLRVWLPVIHSSLLCRYE